MKLSFSSKWYWVVLTLLFIAAFSRLGLWQLHRAADKAHFLELRDRQETIDHLPIFDRDKDRDLYLFRPVTVKGQFFKDSYWYLDNKIQNGRVGYEVVALFRTAQQKLVLVNLGWLQAYKDRSQLPPVSLPQGSVTLSGRIYFGDENRFVGHENISFAKTTVIPQIVFSEMTQEIVQYAPDLTLMPYVIQLSEANPFGYARNWQGELMPPEKHIGYAVQWFAMALAILVIFLVLTVKRVESRSDR